MGNVFKTHSQSFGIVALVAITVSTLIVFLSAKEQKDIRGRAAETTVIQKSAPKKVVQVKATTAVLADTTGPNLVTNGDFSDGETGWNFWNSSGLNPQHSIENGSLVIQAGGAKQNIDLLPNTTYKLVATVTSFITNNLSKSNVLLSSRQLNPDGNTIFESLTLLEFEKDTPETKEIIFTTPSTTTYQLSLAAGSSSHATFDNIGIFDEVTSTPSPTPPPNGTISADPAECIITNGSPCTSNITWVTSNALSAVVCVDSVNGEQVFASGTNGTQAANWIQLNNNSVFKLKTPYTPGTCNGTQLASVTVRGISSTSPTSTPTPPTDTARLVEDINGDGCVSILDFNEWLYAFKHNGTTINSNSHPDVNNDTEVSILDFNLWVTMFKSGTHSLCR